MRNLIVDGKLFRYVVGQTYVKIISPDGLAHVFTIADIKNMRDDDVQRGKWKKTSDGMLTPGQLRRFIEIRIDGNSLKGL